MAATRLVHVLRHAKSSWSDPDADDHDRKLSGRGRRSAAAVAETLEREQLMPQLVLCSSARRAQQTLAPIRDRLPAGSRVLVESGLYAASAATLLRRLCTVDDGVSSVLLIGHNPGLQDLVIALVGPRALEGTGLPTAALVTIPVSATEWAQLGPEVAGPATLRLHSGRDA